MIRYGFPCLVALLVMLTCLVLTNIIIGFSVPTGIGILALLLSVQFANWRFVQTHRRVTLPIELKGFAQSSTPPCPSSLDSWLRRMHRPRIRNQSSTP